MSIISEKVSYLKGLAEGLKIDTSTSEGKLLTEIINVLGEIADDIEYLEDSQDELFDRVYDLEDDMDDMYGMEDDDDEFDDEDGSFVVSCPSCEDEFYVGEDDFDSADPIECPNCGQEIELEIDCDCDDCNDCDC